MPEPKKHLKISDINITTEEEYLRPGVGARITGTITVKINTEISEIEWRNNRGTVQKLVEEQINHRIMNAIYGDVATLAREAKHEAMKSLVLDYSSGHLGRHPTLLLLDRIIAMGSGYAEPKAGQP